MYRQSDAVLSQPYINGEFVACLSSRTHSGLDFYYAYMSDSSLERLKERCSNLFNVSFMLRSELLSLPVLPCRVIYLTEERGSQNDTHMEVLFGTDHLQITITDNEIKIHGYGHLYADAEQATNVVIVRRGN